jgi:pimeloyl-[acyl-carrier protein] methyl ester esterase
MRRAFLPGWGSSPEAWQPLAASNSLLLGWDATLEPGIEVVGWSLGAMRALEAATRMKLAGLVLVAATPQFVRRGHWRYGWPPRVLEAMRERLAADPDALLDEFEAGLFAPEEEHVPIPRETDPSVLDEGLRFLAGFSVLDRLEAIRCPVRLLHGGLDTVIPLAAAEHLAAALPHADLTVWEEAGHAPHLTQPARFREWLST